MFKLLIVDDEKNTRESIKKHIAWDELGVDEVRTAKNGIEALEIADSYPPDILLCDIRMPKMGGIELAAEIRSRFPACKLIFLSGFADKEYLKSAISLKALQYIEKPIDIEEIKAAVSEAIAILKEELGRKNEASEARDKLLLSTPLLRSDVALALVSPENGAVTPAVLNSAKLLHFPTEGIYFCVSVLMNWSASTGEEVIAVKRPLLLQSLSRELEANSAELLAGLRPEGEELVLVLAYGKKPSSVEINLSLQAILKKLNEIAAGAFTVSMGIGSSAVSISELRGSYAEAAEAARLSFYGGFGRIYTFAGPLKKDYVLSDDFQDNFREVLMKDLPAALELIRKLTSAIASSRNIEPDKVRELYTGFLLDAASLSERMMPQAPPIKPQIPLMLQQLKKCRTLSGLSDALTAGIGSMFSIPPDSSIPNRKIQEAIRFIHTHYQDFALTVQRIADHTALNQNYLCTLFKRLTGETLNDYINKTRIEYAKKLLRDSGIKMYEVAERAGFSDPNYFATIFKKYAGSTPSQFRNSLPRNMDGLKESKAEI